MGARSHTDRDFEYGYTITLTEVENSPCALAGKSVAQRLEQIPIDYYLIV